MIVIVFYTLRYFSERLHHPFCQSTCFGARNAGRAWLLLVYMKTRKKSNPEPCFSRKSLKPAPGYIQNPFQNQKRPDRPARFRGTVWPRIQLTGFMLAGSSTARADRIRPQALHAAGVGGRGGQGEHELTPLALLALHTDLASGKVDQHLADIQAKTSPPGVQAAGPVLFVEALEHIGQRLGADALTGIPDRDLHLGAQLLHMELDGAARRGKLVALSRML